MRAPAALLERGALTLVALSLLAVVTARAAAVALTYDEAAAYLRYVSSDALSVFNFAVATNHFLHSLLINVSHLVFGSGELALRLPTLAAYVAYLVACVMILARFRNRLLAAAAFLLLNLNPYLLEYFAISRGYGLSLALLMGAVACLLQFMEAPDAARAHSRLRWCLALGVLAVLANFSSLNAFAGIVAAVLCACVAGARRRAEGAPDGPVRVGTRVVWLPVAAAITMSALVFSQDAQLSTALYEPVSVRLGGLEARDMENVSVVGRDLRGRSVRFRRADMVWQLGDVPLSGLRIEVDRSIAERIDRIDVTLGRRPLTSPRGAAGLWTTSEAGRFRVFTSADALALSRPRVPALRGVINWSGDAIYLRSLALHVSGITALVVVWFVVGTLVIGPAGERLRLWPRQQWLLVVSAVAWLGALVAAPLYALHRGGELYYGGSQGFVADALGSLVDRSLYGSAPLMDRTTIAAVVVITAVLLTMGLLAMCRVRRSWTAMARPAALWVVLATAALLSVAQHAVVGTPFPSGRTALFYLPLGTLLVVLVLDGLSAVGALRRVAVAVAAAAAVVSAAHVVNTLQFRFVSDWKEDAATDRALADLVADARQRGAARNVTLGVAPGLFPVARYYASRSPEPRIRVEVAPASREMDYLYIHVGSEAPWMRVLSTYTDVRTVLASTRTD